MSKTIKRFKKKKNEDRAVTSGFEVIGDLTKVLSVYGADGVDRGEIPK